MSSRYQEHHPATVTTKIVSRLCFMSLVETYWSSAFILINKETETWRPEVTRVRLHSCRQDSGSSIVSLLALHTPPLLLCPHPFLLIFPDTLSKSAWQKLERKESTFINTLKVQPPCANVKWCNCFGRQAVPQRVNNCDPSNSTLRYIVRKKKNMYVPTKNLCSNDYSSFILVSLKVETIQVSNKWINKKYSLSTQGIIIWL